VVAKGLMVQDWGLLFSVAATLSILLAVRRWSANRTDLRAGAILLLIGVPILFLARAVGEVDLLQSDALIWPLILMATALPLFGAALIVRGVLGVMRNAARQRRGE
jgi:uncharacterized membrane protein HdeD (DUF308 family)